jgi:hypothetical protein
MLNTLQNIAQAIQILRLPSVAVGAIALAFTVTTVFNSKSHAEDLFLIPSIIALLWAMSTYFFIITFCSIPQKPDQSLPFVSRIKTKAYRLWYWLIGVIFLTTTIAAVAITYRMISIWLKDYSG